MNQDQSQKAAEPLKSLSPAAFLAVNRQGAEPVDESAEAKDNLVQAQGELATIYELRDSRAFQWFEREFIDKPFRSFSEKLRGVISLDPHETIETVQVTYKALREVKTGMLLREILHRELVNPADEDVPRLREKLARL